MLKNREKMLKEIVFYFGSWFPVPGFEAQEPGTGNQELSPLLF
jgi:hypothetical protein